MDQDRINKQLDYLKLAHPNSAEAIKASQDFIEAMRKIEGWKPDSYSQGLAPHGSETRKLT